MPMIQPLSYLGIGAGWDAKSPGTRGRAQHSGVGAIIGTKKEKIEAEDFGPGKKGVSLSNQRQRAEECHEELVEDKKFQQSSDDNCNDNCNCSL